MRALVSRGGLEERAGTTGEELAGPAWHVGGVPVGPGCHTTVGPQAGRFLAGLRLCPEGSGVNAIHLGVMVTTQWG